MKTIFCESSYCRRDRAMARAQGGEWVVVVSPLTDELTRSRLRMRLADLDGSKCSFVIFHLEAA